MTADMEETSGTKKMGVKKNAAKEDLKQTEVFDQVSAIKDEGAGKGSGDVVNSKSRPKKKPVAAITADTKEAATSKKSAKAEQAGATGEKKVAAKKSTSKTKAKTKTKTKTKTKAKSGTRAAQKSKEKTGVTKKVKKTVKKSPKAKSVAKKKASVRKTATKGKATTPKPSASGKKRVPAAKKVNKVKRGVTLNQAAAQVSEEDLDGDVLSSKKSLVGGTLSKAKVLPGAAASAGKHVLKKASASARDGHDALDKAFNDLSERVSSTGGGARSQGAVEEEVGVASVMEAGQKRGLFLRKGAENADSALPAESFTTHGGQDHAISVKRSRFSGLAHTLMRVLWIFLFLCFLGGVGYLAWFSFESRAALNELRMEAEQEGYLSEEETDSLLRGVGALVADFPSERPVVVPLADSLEMKARYPFFINSQDGDHLLLFLREGRVIVYRDGDPREVVADGKIGWNAGVLTDEAENGNTEGDADDLEDEAESNSDAAADEKAFSAEVAVEVRNGSGVSGRAAQVARELRELSDAVSVTSVGNARTNSYEGTVVVAVSGAVSSATLDAIGDAVEGELVENIPEGEGSSEADVLVILGR